MVDPKIQIRMETVEDCEALLGKLELAQKIDPRVGRHPEFRRLVEDVKARVVELKSQNQKRREKT